MTRIRCLEFSSNVTSGFYFDLYYFCIFQRRNRGRNLLLRNSDTSCLFITFRYWYLVLVFKNNILYFKVTLKAHNLNAHVVFLTLQNMGLRNQCGILQILTKILHKDAVKIWYLQSTQVSQFTTHCIIIGSLKKYWPLHQSYILKLDLVTRDRHETMKIVLF